jgi:DNA phosphorothioation-dependent restriction protein DptH
MKYRLMVKTICDYVSTEIERGIKTLRFVLPSYPSGLLLEIGKELRERFERILLRRVELEYRVAYHLGQSWALKGSKQEQANFEAIQENGWYDTDNNLTKIRNMLPASDVECLVIIMAGFEHTTNQGSLQDFYRLDQQTLWGAIMHKSFDSWVMNSLEDYVSLDDDKADLNAISVFLNELYRNGLTDLIVIGEYLENHDFSGVMNGREAYRSILDDLNYFNLPRMGSLSRYGEKLSCGHYIIMAQVFLNYSMFLNGNERQKALKRIKIFCDEKIDSMPEEFMGEYHHAQDLIVDLMAYVEDRNDDARKRLVKADFPYIYDKILRYKLNPKKTIEHPIKLTGVAPEVFLRAIWMTLSKFMNRQGSVGIMEEVFQISLISTQFKHDLSQDEDEKNTFAAKEFLRHILGGIDEYMEEHTKNIFGSESPNEATVQCCLSPSEKNDRLEFVLAKTAEPSLAFEVSILSQQTDPLNKRFLWALPQYHPSRVLNDLFNYTLRIFYSGKMKNGEALFALAIPYISELFQAKDEEEVNRIITSGLNEDKDAGLISLISKDDHLSTKEREIIDELFCKYHAFLKEYDKRGFFSAIGGDCYDGLRMGYQKLCQSFIENSSTSQIGSLLMKAFMVVSKRETVQSNWKWNKFLSAAVVTPLHPAMLEMLLHQYVFLFKSFSYYLKKAIENPREKGLTIKAWDQIVDLARIQRPVFATIKNDDGVLDTNIRGYGYIHMVGNCSEPVTSSVSRFLLEYDSDEEEEISDSDLFRTTRESELVRRLLCDYLDLHPYANDGITIGAFCGQDVQPLIAGIDDFIKIVTSGRDEQIYSLNLIIFTDSADDSTVMKWVNAWKEHWQAGEIANKKYYYSRCLISISYCVVLDIEGQFANQIKSRNFDVFIFSNFIQSGSSRFVELGDEVISRGDYQKFPILDKICCRQNGGGRDLQRERILSYGQFRLACLHSEILERIKTGHQSLKKHLVVSKNDYGFWEKTISTAHKASTWVICIDPVIDEYIIRNGLEGLREIIGFGTGVGSHGESNYTVSTEQFTISDVKKKIGSQALALFNLWDHPTAENIANSIIKEASYIGGLSLVRATGFKDTYIHDFFAYSILRKMLPRDSNAFCDEIISLDAFRHWFVDDSFRPDLLRVQAYICNGYFHIEAQIIECKLAKYSEGYLTKARQQIESGLSHLVNYFQPRKEGKPLGITRDGKLERPDQRYWWMQLHRLITSKGFTEHFNYTSALQAMERLSEGLYNIRWRAAAVAFWTDYNPEFESIPEWQYDIDDQKMQISVVTAGSEFVRKVCLENIIIDIFSNNKGLTYSFVDESEHNSPQLTISDRVKDEVRSIDNNHDIKLENEAIIEEPPKKGVVSQIPERILLGSSTSGSRDFYWEFGHPDLPNRHILIFGASGTGKTYAIQGLLSELGKSGQNSLIIDYTNGFTPKQLERIVVQHLNPQQYIVRNKPIPINPFRKQSDYIDELEIEENPANVAQRVMGVFSEVYNLGDQQRSALYNAIRVGVESQGDNFNLQSLLGRLRLVQEEGGPTASSATSVISKIQPFIDLNPFGQEDNESWEKIFSDFSSRCHIIQLATFSKKASRLITEFALFDLYRYYRGRGLKNNPKVIVLDEIQNLDHSLNSPLGQFLTEGRKFGISLILATQTLSNLDKDQKDRLFQASHKLFFKPADTEVKSFAQILETATGSKTEEWMERLASLKRGECYSLGFTKNEVNGRFEVKCNKIRIKQLEARF